MKTALTLAILTIIFPLSIFAQDKLTFSEDYSFTRSWNKAFHIPLDAGGNPFWLSYSTGEVKVENGAVQFANASCGKAEKRVWRPLGRFLGDEWTARMTFTPTQGNTSWDKRTGATVIGFTAGSKDAHNDLAEPVSSASAELSDQDGIYVLLLSANSPSASIYLDLVGKDGTSISRTRDNGQTITISYGTTYYFELKRTSSTQAQFKVFTDASYSTQSGSTLTLTIPSTIEGLGVVQHGTIPAGGYTRKLTATLDNLQVLESSGACLICPNQSVTTTTNQNRIITETARRPVTTESAFDALSTGGEKEVRVGYFDGLGRPLQSIDIQGAPDGGDMIQYHQYDEFGREAQVDLPYVANSTGGAYQANPQTDQQAFYTTGNFPGMSILDENKAHSITQFEASPLNRVIEQGFPGNDWQPESNSAGTQSSSEHTLISDYRANTSADIVVRFPYNLSIGQTVTTIYPDDELMVNETTDENGNLSRTFTDKLGRVVCQESQVDAGTYARMYTVYDFRGQPIYILQPEGVKEFLSNNYGGAAKFSQSLIDDYAFQYKYDERGRVIEKKIPGAEKVFMVYDKLDRVVATQDGEQRKNGEWLFTKYDILGRLIITGLIELTSVNSAWNSRSAVQAQWDQIPNGTYQLYEERGDEVHTGTGPTGYTNQTFPDNFDIYLHGEIHSITYYDDYEYNYLSSPFQAYRPDLDNFPNNTPTYQTRGMVTGVKVKVLNQESGMSSWLFTQTFYDQYSREIQTIADNHLGGEDQTDYAYSFVGEVTASRHIHKGQASGSAGVYEKGLTTWKFYTYDQRGRLLHTEQRTEDPFNSGQETESVVLARHEYNSLGQSIQKNLHQDVDADKFWQSVDYRYNIRGWLTEINEPDFGTSGSSEDFFGMELYYNENGGTGTTPCYNGNISVIKWQSDIDANHRKQQYGFTYDGLNRLLTGAYIVDNNGTPTEIGDFNVDLTYDLNGNITFLERDGLHSFTTGGGGQQENGPPTSPVYNLIDDLTYNYSGNQLDRVRDDATNTAPDIVQFIDGTNTGDDYEYDDNGNLEMDLNKNITSIVYNHLNKPTSITYGDGKQIRYFYGADGTKLRQTVYDGSTIIKRSDYLGGIHYEDADGDGTSEGLEILFAQHEEGRYRPNGSEMIYEYTLTDHLGNTRITFGDSDADGDADILQENHYYPFGMAMTTASTSSAAPPNDYLYNGKELQTELGLDWYDYGARMYDASIGRWSGADALAEVRPSWTPFRAFYNNPISYVDPTGNLESTDVERNEDGSYTVIGAQNDGDNNIYVVDESGYRSEVIGQTLMPFDFMGADNKTGEFYFDKNENGVTFRLDDLTVSGDLTGVDGYSMEIENEDGLSLVGSSFNFFIHEKAEDANLTAYGDLRTLKRLSASGEVLDLKVTLGNSAGGQGAYTPIGYGKTDTGLPVITTLRAVGNISFGANMRYIQRNSMFGQDFFYRKVMEKVGDYNQSQGGNGYNIGVHPYYGEHTYSGSFIFRGYFDTRTSDRP